MNIKIIDAPKGFKDVTEIIVNGISVFVRQENNKVTHFQVGHKGEILEYDTEAFSFFQAMKAFEEYNNAPKSPNS